MPSARVARPGVRGISPAALEVQRSCTVSAPFRLRRPDAGHSGTAFQLVLPRLASRPCAAIYRYGDLNALATDLPLPFFESCRRPCPGNPMTNALPRFSPAAIVPRPRSATSDKNEKTARAEDIRRKVIAGALALEHATRNPGSEFARIMVRLLDEYARPQDRRLFAGLLPGPSPAPDAGNLAGDDMRAIAPESVAGAAVP